MHIFRYSPYLLNLGIFVIRVGLGIIFIKHGFPKIIGGTEKWLWLGSQMKNIGIEAIPVFWGFCAAIAEFGGGIGLILGLATRICAFLISCVMIVAISYHIQAGDSFAIMSHPTSLLIVFCGLMITGGGKWSFDYLIRAG